jgi:2-polyprenyl-6-methoxyphenol hydroxylase-like FAD-dependent oxidoreductase
MAINSLDVGICGFGVAGGALAVFLARAGHRVTILERAPQLGPVGAGFLLHPSGQKVLEKLGLLDAVVSKSARIARLEAFTRSGHRLTDLRYDRGRPGLCAYGVQRDVLFKALFEAANAAGVGMALSADICELQETAESVRLRDVSERAFGPFDLVVGADGARSQVRAWLNEGSNPRREYTHGALWGTGPLGEPSESLYQATRGARQLLGLLPIGEGRVAFFWGIRRDRVEVLKARGYEAFREEVALLSPRAVPVVNAIGSFENLAFAGYLHDLPHRVHSSCLGLIGDAAHAMSPHLGQGANLALLDAECLARHLAQAPVAFALEAYAKERRGHARYLSFLSRVLSPFFQSQSRVLGWARDLALPLMSTDPWFRRQMELTVAGLKQGFFDQL